VIGGRYVARARGRALGAAGVPRTPNLPDGRTLARRAVRDAVPTVRRGRRRAGDAGCDRRSVGDREPPLAAVVVAVVGLLLAVYLLLAEGVPDQPARPAETCADRVVYHGARLRDC
jgi:hypothetical protein